MTLITTRSLCPRCHGPTRTQPGPQGSPELVCVTGCGWDGAPITPQPTPDAPADPFAHLVAAIRETHRALNTRLAKAEKEAITRRDQVRRLDKALKILDGPQGAAKPARPGPGLCRTCGNPYATKAHKTACRTPA